MKSQVLVLLAIFMQEIIAGDHNWIQKGSWKNQLAGNHGHYRHHRHHQQMCEATTSNNPFINPNGYDLYFPGNLAGDLTSSGTDCGESLTKQAVSF